MGGWFGTALLLASVLSLPAGPVRLDANGDPLPAGALFRLGSVRWRHGNSVRAVIFTDQGKTLISGSWDKTIAVRDVKTGKLLRRWKAHDEWVNALALGPDGKTLASGGWDGSLYLWDPATGKELGKLPGHDGPISTLTFSPDGKTLASGGDDRVVHLWDVGKRKELKQLTGHRCEIRAVAFSPDGKSLASGGGTDNTVRLWDLASGVEVHRFEGHQDYLTGLVFAANGKTLISTSADNTIRFWDVEACVEAQTLQGGLKEEIWALALSPDGKHLATSVGSQGVPDVSIRLWEVASGKEVRTFAGHGLFVGCLAFSPDGQTLASGGTDSTIRLWDVATGKDMDPQPGHQAQVTCLAFAPDGKTLVSGSYDRSVRLWDTAAGKEIHRMETKEGLVFAVAFAPDGSRIASGGKDRVIRLWDPSTGKEIRSFNGHLNTVLALAFTPDGKCLASSSYDNSLRIWETETGKGKDKFDYPSRYWYALAYSARGQLLAAAIDNDNQAVVLCEPAARRDMGRIMPPKEQSFSYTAKMAISPHGRMAALSGGEARTIRLFELASGKERLEFANHPADVTALALSPDGRVLASADRDGGQHFWDLASGKELRRATGHQGYVTALAFSPDGKVLASSSTDTTLLLWDVADLARRAPSKATLKEEDLRGAWDALADTDAAKAFQAVRALTATPEQAVSLLRERLRSAKPADARTVAKLLKDLDSDDFDVREKATKELEKLGDRIEAQLQKAKDGQPSAEAGGRIKSLLDRVQSDTTPDHLRMLRAFEVLEDLDTPEARQLLRTLAETEPGDRVTREAKDVLARMRKRLGGKP